MPSNRIFIRKTEELKDPFSIAGRMLERFDKNVDDSNYQVVGFDFGSEAVNVSSFDEKISVHINQIVFSASAADSDPNVYKRYGLTREIDQASLKPVIEDTFGNSFNLDGKFDSYDTVELRVDPSYENFVSVKLFDSENNKRFIISNVENYNIKEFRETGKKNKIFSPTTLRIASDIDVLSVSEQHKQKERETISSLLKCRDTNALERVKNLPVVPELQNFLESRIEYDEWSTFIDRYALPKPKIVSKGSIPLSQRDVKNASRELDKKSVKTDEELAREERLLAGARLKLDLNEVREKGFDLNDSSSVFLGDSRGLRNRLRTLEDCYTELMDRVSLGCLIQSALECVIPPVDCKTILRGIRVENLRERIDLALPNLPKVADEIKGEIDKLEDPDDIDAALDVVEKFIDLEAICDIGILFDLPTFDFDFKLPIVDLFGGIGDLLDNAILDALIRALKNFINGILDDLLACDNLDTFIVGALEGDISASPDLVGDLNAVFNSSDLPSSLGGRWDTFKRQTAEALAKETEEGDIPFILGVDINEQDENIIQDDGDFFTAKARTNVGLEVFNVVDKLSRGEEVRVEDTLVISSMLEAGIDVTKVVNLEGTGAQQFREFLGEIGKFQLSDDGKSLTLNRISDDQVVNIFKARSLAEKADRQLLVTGQALADGVGQMLNDTVALLSPTETLNLFAGEPSPQTLELVSGVAKTKYKELDFLSQPQKVRTLFKNFGQLTGLSDLRDRVRLLETVPCAKPVPRKFCPEDDDRVKIRERILRNGGASEGEIDSAIKDITDKQTERYNELLDSVVTLNKGETLSEEALDNIACGLQVDGTMNPITDSMVNRTISLIYEPVRMSFDKEILNYPKSLSTQKNKTKEISRVISGDGIDLKVFNPLAFSDENQPILKSLGIEFPSDDVINPELQRLISTGFTPTKEDGSAAEPKDNGLYEDAKDFFEIPDTTVEVGEYYRRSIALETGEVEISDGSFLLSGQLPVQNNSAEAISLYRAASEEDEIDAEAYGKAPSWNIRYLEEGEQYSLNIDAAGSLKSPFFGSVPFSEDFSYSAPLVNELNADTRNRLQEISSKTDKSEIFVDWASHNLGDVVLEDQSIDGLDEFLTEKHNDVLKGFFKVIAEAVADNRLLQKLPSKNNKGENEEDKLIVLNLVDFSPEPTEEQRECGLDPHLLDPESIKKIVREQFDSLCAVNEDTSGLTPVRQPINSSGLSGVVMTTIRLYCIDYILRGLFVLDNFEYAEDIFIQNDVFIDYVRFRIEEDMKNRDEGYYKEFLEEVEVTYNSVFGSEGERVFIEKFKFLIRDQMTSALQRVREIVGPIQSRQFNEILIERLPTVDVYDFENYGRFQDSGLDLNEGGIVLEKYIRVNGQVYSLSEWQSLIDGNQAPSGNRKYGMRMSYVLPVGEGAPLRNPDQESDRRYLDGYTFNVPANSIDLDPALVNKERTYYSIKTKSKKKGETTVVFDILAREVNSIPILEKEMGELDLDAEITELAAGISLEESLSILGETEQVYRNRYENSLKRMIRDDVDFDLMMNHVFMSKKVVTMFLLHSSMILNGEENKFLFEGTKSELKRVFDTMKNIGNYNFDNVFSKDFYSGNSGEFQKAFNDIGNPAGPQAASAFYYASITPLLILKGLVEISDPNIFVTSKIAAAAANGLLVPKRNEETGDLEYPGESLFLPYSVIANALLPVNIYTLIGGSGPPLTPIGLQFLTLEPLLWGLPFFQNMFKTSDVSVEIRDKFNLNLNSSEQIGCEDEEES